MLLYGQENQQNCYIARLVVRREVKLTSLGRTQPIFRCALSRLTWMGTTKKVEGHIKKVSAGALRRHFMPLHFQIVSGATGRYSI